MYSSIVILMRYITHNEYFLDVEMHNILTVNVSRWLFLFPFLFILHGDTHLAEIKPLVCVSENKVSLE